MCFLQLQEIESICLFENFLTLVLKVWRDFSEKWKIPLFFGIFLLEICAKKWKLLIIDE